MDNNLLIFYMLAVFPNSASLIHFLSSTHPFLFLWNSFFIAICKFLFSAFSFAFNSTFVLAPMRALNLSPGNKE